MMIIIIIISRSLHSN